MEIAGDEAARLITLLNGTRLTRTLEPGGTITAADSLVLRLYRESIVHPAVGQRPP